MELLLLFRCYLVAQRPNESSLSFRGGMIGQGSEELPLITQRVNESSLLLRRDRSAAKSGVIG